MVKWLVLFMSILWGSATSTPPALWDSEGYPTGPALWDTPGHDVGVQSIDSPDTAAVNHPYIPQATVENCGDFGEVFDVVCEILSPLGLYADSLTGIELGPDSTRSVEFQAWVPGEPGTYLLTVYTLSLPDENPANDTLSKPIEVITGIEEEKVRPAPERYGLGPPQPNPVSGITRVSYDLPARALVEIRVYDITGRPVKLLVSGLQAPGHNSTTWDLRDDLGRRVPQGIYFIRMETTEYKAIAKLGVVFK